MCISERLKQVLDAKNMTVTEFSNVTGISYRSAMNNLNEGRDPNVDALIKIYKGIKINITWLLTGEGEMFSNTINKNILSDSEKELILNYREMPADFKNALFTFLTEIKRAIKY